MSSYFVHLIYNAGHKCYHVESETKRYYGCIQDNEDVTYQVAYPVIENYLIRLSRPKLIPKTDLLGFVKDWMSSI